MVSKFNALSYSNVMKYSREDNICNNISSKSSKNNTNIKSSDHQLIRKKRKYDNIEDNKEDKKNISPNQPSSLPPTKQIKTNKNIKTNKINKKKSIKQKQQINTR